MYQPGGGLPIPSDPDGQIHCRVDMGTDRRQYSLLIQADDQTARLCSHVDRTGYHVLECPIVYEYNTIIGRTEAEATDLCFFLFLILTGGKRATTTSLLFLHVLPCPH